MLFPKHENVSTACRFTSLHSYVLAPLCPCVLMSLRPYVPAQVCLRPYVGFRPIYATSLIVFTLLISMPRVKSTVSYQISSKIKLFLPKNAKFSSVGYSAPRPPASGGWGLSSQISKGFRRIRPQTPKTAPTLRSLATNV